jgi:cell division septal protein FtsQ
MKRSVYIRLRKKLLQALTILAACFVLYIYFRTGLFTIRHYAIEGAPAGYEENLKRDASLIAENAILGFIPGNRILSYRDDDLRTLIVETLPNTRSISIHPSGLHTLSIKIEHHEPIFAVSDTHAIAEDGTVYKEIMPLDSFARIEMATSSSIKPDVLRSIANLTAKLDTVLFEIGFISVDEFNDLRLYDKDKESFVLLSSNADFDLVWSNLLSAIDTNPLKDRLARHMDQLLYLDTRFGNKIFYKFTTDADKAIIPSTDASSATTTIQ